jgi:S-formylglutathione hydrolase
MNMNINDFQLETRLVSSPVKYSVLLPDDYDETKHRYPLLFALHGGNGNSNYLKTGVADVITSMWESDELDRMIVVTPECNRSFYMDNKGGTQKWESFIITELIPHLIQQFRIEGDRILLSGTSMGGLGTLRFGFKYPSMFKLMVAFEPGIEPALEWDEIRVEDRFYRDDKFMESLFGSPIDKEYWKNNNPASILLENVEKIKNSGIKIYLEVGTEDMLGLYRGAEFLHRLMFDHGLKHEYRLVYGADHVGGTFKERFRNGFAFINRILNPPGKDIQVIQARNFFERVKTHYIESKAKEKGNEDIPPK